MGQKVVKKFRIGLWDIEIRQIAPDHYEAICPIDEIVFADVAPDIVETQIRVHFRVRHVV